MADSGELVIRSLRPSDEAFISELGRAAFGEYTRTSGGTVLAMARRGRTLVATKDGERLGFAVVEVRAAGAHLSAISVAEHARGRGVARRLLAAAEKAARRAGAASLGLVTADSNLAALELFLHAGFRRVGRERRYYQRGQNAVRMEKSL